MNAHPVEETAKEKLLHEGSWVTISVETIPGTSAGGGQMAKRSTLLSLEQAGKIFGFRRGDSVYYASYQFDANPCAIPIVEEVLRILGSLMSKWAIAAWFDFPNSWIIDQENGVFQPRKPKSVLDRCDALRRAASNAHGIYVA